MRPLPLLSLSLSLSLSLALSVAEPDLSKVRFYLWTRRNPGQHQEVWVEEEASIVDSCFDPNQPTVILAHGWNSHGRGYGESFAPSYLELGDFNVFSIDWGDLENWNYLVASKRPKPVGTHAAGLVELLVKVGAAVGSMHLVGHSLGAHVVGFLAKEVQARGLGRVARVTGLDPAKPNFDIAGPENRIDKGDADFVDIVHTNSGWLWEGCLSLPEPIGHIDFYPAGGKHQPGCLEICGWGGQVCSNATIDDLIKGGCSHDRANQYYKESILSSSFVASSCDSWEDWEAGLCCGQGEAPMGEGLAPTYHGGPARYFLSVAEEAPHGLGEAGLPGCRHRARGL